MQRRRRRTFVGVAVCCGALAVPATATATHMSDMPWCPHSEQQGADPAAGLPGGGSGPAGRAAPSPAPAATPAPSPRSAPATGSAPAARGVPQPARAAQPAQVAQPASAATAAGTTVASAIATQPATTLAVAQGGAVVPQAVVDRAAARRAAAAARARAEARARAREEARQRTLSLARARALTEDARSGVAATARRDLVSPEGWTSTATATEARSLPAGALGALVAALVLVAGAGALLRRRRGDAPRPAVLVPPVTPVPDASAAIEAELQEIIAEERAAAVGRSQAPAG